MKIKKFRGRNIHGYLNPNVSFRDDLTFLIGINGAGKTTIVNCIVALLAPDFAYVGQLAFDELELVVENESQLQTIRWKKVNDQNVVSISSATQELQFPTYSSRLSSSTPSLFDPSSFFWPSARGTSPAAYYGAKLRENADHPVVKAIEKLPTPWFLGLERRAYDKTTPKTAQVVYTTDIEEAKSGIFGINLSEALAKAAEIANDSYAKFLRDRDALGDQLRNTLIREAFSPSQLHRSFGRVRIKGSSLAKHGVCDVDPGLRDAIFAAAGRTP